MVEDRGRHKEIRKKILGTLRGKSSWDAIHTSHTKDGDVYLFGLDANKNRVYVTKPDIVCLKEKKAKLIIEIELSSQPKHIFGVVSANNAAQEGVFCGDPFVLDKPTLIIVVDLRGKEKGNKLNQISLIKNSVDRGIRPVGIGRVEIETCIKNEDLEAICAKISRSA